MIVDRSSFTSFPPVLGHLAFLGGCLHGGRGEDPGPSWTRAEQRSVAFTSRNFGPCGAKAEI